MELPNDDDPILNYFAGSLRAMRVGEAEADAVLRAMSQGDSERVLAMVRAHPRLATARTPFQDCPLIHLAAQNGTLEVMQLLLQHGASVADRDHGHIGNGQTTMLAAAYSSQPAAVYLLLDHGADINEAGGAEILGRDPGHCCGLA